MSQNMSYSCQINLTDADGDNVTVTQDFGSDREIFNVSSGGLINFTPSNDDVGNYSVVFTADDGVSCSNSLLNTTFNFTVENVNDPPYLVQNIPNQNITVNVTLSAFFLSDYFADPDNDVLNYTSTIPSNVTVTIFNTSEVQFRTASCTPTSVLVIFTATDPSNASVDSNVITITITCTTPADDDDDDNDDDEQGGGGGGGGGSICLPSWECQEWFSCLPSGEQWRRCYDTAACQSDRYLTRLCTYEGPSPVCGENWLCSEWGNCFLNGTQQRTCSDLSACGTTIVMPSLVQECVYNPTCNDGVKNGDEEGIDCGGLCAACPLVQKPSIIDAGIATWLLWIIILAILISGGVLHYYRSELAKGVALLGFLFRREAYKEILLSKEQRLRMFERFVTYEQKEGSREPDELYDDLALLIRQYMFEALNVHIESLPEEILERCKQLSLRKETMTIVTGLLAKLEVIEHEELTYDPYFVRYTVEEIRTLVCLTSEYEQQEILRSLEEIMITDDMSFYDEIFARMTNVLRAVQFDQLEIAKREYVKLLEVYDPLDVADKEQVFNELSWTFTTVRFASEITGTRTVRKPAPV